MDRHRHHWVNYYLLDWPAQYKHGLKSIEEETRDDATKDKIELALGAVKDNEDFAKVSTSSPVTRLGTLQVISS